MHFNILVRCIVDRNLGTRQGKITLGKYNMQV